MSTISGTPPLHLAVVLKQRGITQIAFADSVGMSESHLSHVLNGHTKPSRRLRQHLSLVLGMDEESLFTRCDEVNL